MKGIILEIARACFHDGPGIRTTVFLKGCPYKCPWCHNPESIKMEPQVAMDEVTGKQHVMGYVVTIDDVMASVIQDMDYYKASGGGLTISGGEPMLQFEFTLALARKAKQAGIHVAIETAGYGERKQYKQLLPYVDIFMMDYKYFDKKKLKALTGCDYDQVEGHVKWLDEQIQESTAKTTVIIRRCPIIPTINDNEIHIRAICEMSLKYHHVAYVELLPYHHYGVGKAKRIQAEYILKNLENMDDKASLQRIKTWVAQYPHGKIRLHGEDI
ncbi:radical SAM protein [Vallitalea pronyensis]|uniref:Radical SAM protein n=1 Tax=Vallitalea pronyensis TaxID=1348613 RepID=A0A8J8SF81_9FIRM|nr:4Fe-4S cluster-binding domain-containing protein [Vallitalea pronyensis]QUI21029.1 radical SAM protein [Vallitalea pronyensis]